MVIIGSLAIPLLVLWSYVYGFDFIDNLIGADAGKYHGYTSLLLVFYPILMPIYWLAMFFVDKKFINKTLTK